jgi:antitoxin YefM
MRMGRFAWWDVRPTLALACVYADANGALCERVWRGGAARELAILLAMTISEQMSLADVKNRLSEVVDTLEREHGRVVITRHGHPAAVVISVADLESLEETLDIMGSEDLLSDIREGLAEISVGGADVLGKDDALRLIPGR